MSCGIIAKSVGDATHLAPDQRRDSVNASSQLPGPFSE